MFTRCLDTFMEKLLPRLEQMDRGSVLAPEEVERITGQPCTRLESRIRSHFWRQGKSMVRRDGMLYILTDDEEVEQAVRDAGRSRRAVGRGVHRLGGLDKEKLRADTHKNLGLIIKELTIVHETAGAAVRVMSRAIAAATAPTPRRLTPGSR